MNVNISEIQIVPVKPVNGLVGFSSFVLNGYLYLGSIGIYTRPKGGYRLTFPMKNNLNVFYPINKDFSQFIEGVVVREFEKVTKAYARHNKTNTK